MWARIKWGKKARNGCSVGSTGDVGVMEIRKAAADILFKPMDETGDSIRRGIGSGECLTCFLGRCVPSEYGLVLET